MPTITTVDATWDTGVAMDAAELRRADTTMFLGDGSNSGVRGGIVYHGPNSLAVAVNGSDQVSVQAGAAVIPAATGLGVYRTGLSATTTLVNLAARNATNPRIDLVVIQVAGASAVVKTIDGTPAASPTAPALPAQHIELARITVPATGGGAVTVDSTFRTFATGLGGTLFVPTAVRLPASGNVTGQEALALDTGLRHRYTGTVWETQNDGPVSTTLGSGVSAPSEGGVQAWKRGGTVQLAIYISNTSGGTIASGATLFTLGAGYRPPRIWRGFVSNAGGTAVRCAVATGGTFFIEGGWGAGDLLYGSMSFPAL